MNNHSMILVLGKFAGRILLGLILLAVAATLILAVYLLIRSPGNIKPFLDDNGEVLPGSIAEKIYVEIGGVEQGMIIRGKDAGNPVLLYLHGGSAMPNYYMAEDLGTPLDEEFTVCWWEQRGAGLSYTPGMDLKSITVEQLLDDTTEVTNYLRERFGQEKIYLLGSSWGSFLGIQEAARHPELYHAYLGLSQMTRQGDSERMAYEYMLEQYTAQGNTRRVRQLQEAYADMENVGRDFRDTAMHELGIGTTREMKSVVTGIF